MSEEKMVTIPASQFESLKAMADKLWALEVAGVDNWEGYSDAIANMAEASHD